MAGGRPRKMRVPGSGEKIQAALRTAGLTWSSANVFAPNHVLHNKRWKRCGLPMSATTVASDIRLGSPVDRLGQYAAFFGLTPEMLSDAGLDPYGAQFSCEVLKNKHKAVTVNPLPLHTEDPTFCHLLTTYNSRENVSGSFEVLGGLFRLYLQEMTNEPIFMAVVYVHGQETNHLVFRGYTRMHGVDVHIEGRLFRWGTFLHVNYFSADGQVLGYMITHDPSMLAVATYRKTLRLPLVGLAGGLLSPVVPDRFYGYAEKISPENDASDSAEFERLCGLIRQDPVVDPADPEHQEVLRRITLVRQSPSLFHLG